MPATHRSDCTRRVTRNAYGVPNKKPAATKNVYQIQRRIGIDGPPAITMATRPTGNNTAALYLIEAAYPTSKPSTTRRPGAFVLVNSNAARMAATNQHV